MNVNQTILGGPHVDGLILRTWLALRRPTMDVAELDDVIAGYCAFGQLARIGNLIPFAQAWKETEGFVSPRWARSYNPAGLGATSDGSWGHEFSNAAEGIVAQYAHLLAYAAKPKALTPAQLRMIPFDPRLDAMTKAWGRGSAPRWIDLNGKWAVPGKTYGQEILDLAEIILRGAA